MIMHSIREGFVERLIHQGIFQIYDIWNRMHIDENTRVVVSMVFSCRVTKLASLQSIFQKKFFFLLPSSKQC